MILVEGIVMCFVLLIICVVGIANGPVGLVVFNEQEVKNRVVELGLTTRVCFQKHKPRKKMRKYAVSQIKPKGKQGGNVEYNP